jgi:hypothetical protein
MLSFPLRPDLANAQARLRKQAAISELMMQGELAAVALYHRSISTRTR